ncbi:MAG: SulP family inorganic anion transporter, partial [Gammaproteobacteria bacterium]
KRTFNIGRERMVIFVITVVAILATDLLAGILIGVLAEILLLLYLLTPSLRVVLTGRLTVRQALKLLWSNFAGMFRNPVIAVKTEERAGKPHYQISLGSMVCFNLLPLDRLLASLPASAGVTLIVTESGRIIDHAAMEYLHRFQEESVHDGRVFEIQGMEHYQAFTEHSLAARMHDAKLVRAKARSSARSELMARVAKQHGLQFSPARVDTLNIHDFVYLRRGDDRHERNVMTGSYRGFAIKLYDYSHTAAPDYYSEHRHTIIKLWRESAGGEPWPNLAITPGNYLERYLVEYQEADLASQPALAQHYRLYAREPERALSLVGARLAEFLLAQPGFYVEIHNNVLLAFRPEHGLEPPEGITQLLALADAMGRPSKSASTG